MNILVTGAAGFIGSHLSEHLVTGGTVEDMQVRVQSICFERSFGM